MAPTKKKEQKANNPHIHMSPYTSQDLDRNREDARHHPESHPLLHPEHHPQKQPSGEVRHYPHTHGPVTELNIDHGTHEDRPRPGKLAKKGKRTDS